MAWLHPSLWGVTLLWIRGTLAAKNRFNVDVFIQSQEFISFQSGRAETKRASSEGVTLLRIKAGHRDLRNNKQTGLGLILLKCLIIWIAGRFRTTKS